MEYNWCVMGISYDPEVREYFSCCIRFELYMSFLNLGNVCINLLFNEHIPWNQQKFWCTIFGAMKMYISLIKLLLKILLSHFCNSNKKFMFFLTRRTFTWSSWLSLPKKKALFCSVLYKLEMWSGYSENRRHTLAMLQC